MESNSIFHMHSGLVIQAIGRYHNLAVFLQMVSLLYLRLRVADILTRGNFIAIS